MIQKAETASAAETAGCSLLILSLIYYIFNAVIAQWQSTYAAYVKTWIKNVVYPLKKPNIIELAICDSRHRRRSTFDSQYIEMQYPVYEYYLDSRYLERIN